MKSMKSKSMKSKSMKSKSMKSKSMRKRTYKKWKGGSNDNKNSYLTKLQHLYPACKHDDDHQRQSNKTYEGHRVTYGEMDYEGIQQLYEREILLHHREPHQITTFMDIGSGRGKLCLWMAAQPNIQKSIGVELVKSRHDDAVKLKHTLEKEYPNITEKIEFLNSDVLSIDLKSKCANPGIAFVWFSNLCFDQTVTDKIFEKLKEELPTGSFICCSKEPGEQIRNGVKKINSLKSEPVKIKMSWMDGSSVYIYQIA